MKAYYGRLVFWFSVLLMASGSSYQGDKKPLPIKTQSAIINEIKELYEPWAKAHEKNFTITINKDSLVESAEAYSDGTNLRLGIQQGLLQSPRLSEDGFRMVLCHEIGHLLGGAPRRNVPFEWTGPVAEDSLSFLSSEGEADYYASLVCFRKLVKGQDHSKIKELKQAPARLVGLCNSAFKDSPEDSLICQRAALGGLNLLKLTYEFPISLEAQDQTVAPQLIRDSYPDRQCRLDTFVAGALCRNEFPLSLDFMDASRSDCPQPEASRPKCWYRNDNSGPPLSL